MAILGDDGLYPNPYHRTVGFTMTNGKESKAQIVQMGDVILTALGLSKQYRRLVMAENITRRFSGFICERFPDPLDVLLKDDRELAQLCVDFQNTLKDGKWTLV